MMFSHQNPDNTTTTTTTENGFTQGYDGGGKVEMGGTGVAGSTPGYGQQYSGQVYGAGAGGGVGQPMEMQNTGIERRELGGGEGVRSELGDGEVGKEKVGRRNEAVELQ